MIEQEINWLLWEKYQGQKSDTFLSDVERLKAGEPLAYLIGHIPFLNTEIGLESKPLIPRAETEFWVGKVIAEITKSINNKNEIRILDLCAGSGCIGIAVAKAVPETVIDFIELEERHLKTIEKNCLRNHVDLARVNIAQSDLFDILLESNKYDFILTNPPYIDAVLDRTEISVRENEPEVALYGGLDGLEIISEIIREAPSFLNLQGQLWLEHEPEQIEKISLLATDKFITKHYVDQYCVNRFTKLVLQ